MTTPRTSLMITRNHWIAAAMLAALICGVSCSDNGNVKTKEMNEPEDIKPNLFALCESPDVTSEAIEALLKAGANIEARDENGNTPLIRAAAGNKNPKVIEALLKAGADIEARDSFGGTPLMFAAWGNDNPKVIESLLKAGADTEARDANGKTPLMQAANNNSSPEVIEAILKAGANAKAKDKYGKTAADRAKDNEKIYKTKVYWKLNEAQYE